MAETDPAGAAADPADVLDRPEAGALVIRGGAIRGVAYVLGLVLTAATVPLMTRHLGVVDFGRFVTASSVVMIVAGITEFGLNGVGMREYALASPDGRRSLLASLLGLRTVLTVAGLAVAALLMILASYPRVVVGGMLVSGVGLVLLNAEQTYAISLTAGLRWGVSSLFDLTNSVVIAAGTVLLVVIGATLFPFFYVSVASSLAALVAAAVYLRGRVPLLPRFDVTRWRALLADTLPYAAAATVAILYPRIGLIVVSLVGSAHQTGYYSTAFKVVEVLGGFSGLIAGSAFPVFARAGRDDHERLRYATSRVGEAATIAGTYLVMSLVVAAPFVIRVLGGSGFGPAVPVLRLQAIALLGGFMAATWSYTLLALRMHGSLLRATSAALVASVVLSALLVPGLGAKGASIASAVAELAVAAAYLFALVRRHPDLRPSLGTLPRVALATGCALALGLALPLPSVAGWAIASVVYVGLLFALRAVPEEILSALLARRHPG